MSASPGREIAMTVVRGGSSLTLRMTPETVPDTDVVTGSLRQVGRVGMQTSTDVARQRVSLIASVPLGTAAAWRLGVSVVDVLKGLVSGHISVTQLGGPIAIARTSVAEAKRGMGEPADAHCVPEHQPRRAQPRPDPVAGRWSVALQTAETVKGSAFTDRTREWIARVGLAAIAALFLVVTFNDLKSLVGSLLR